MASINFDNALGIHPKALQMRAARAEVIANNLANADTPGFKSRDFNFQAALAGEMNKGKTMPVERTHAGHLAPKATDDDGLLYRTPMQPSIDGNTVETQIEQAIFSRNAMSYNSSFEFLNRKFNGLTGAIRGE